MSLQPGDLLKDQYRIERLLGRGGFGFVYLAQDTLLREDVAIKELIPALIGDEAQLKRFLAEAKATIRLTHERIVRTHAVFAERGNYYIVMEYMTGGALEERLKEHTALPVDEAIHVAADVAEGLAYAHEHGVVHCDLKPANVLFTADGHAKIADFGIAHVPREMFSRSWLTPSGFVAGTLPYISPEQADGVRDDPRADLYALGAVLYRMLTGRTYLDFDERDTPGAQARNVGRIQAELPQPLGVHNRRVPVWLDAVVLKALAKRPEDRYASAAQMGEALAHKGAAPGPAPAEAETVVVPPAPKPAPIVGANGRSPLLVAVGVTAVFLVAVVGVLLANVIGGGGKKPTPTVTRSVVAQATVAARLPTVTSRPTDTAAPKPTATSVPPTSTIAPTAVPALGIGSTMISEQRDMTLLYVSAGEFLMGSTDADPDAFGDEKPQHKVTLAAFWIDHTEVTKDQYQKCVQAGKCAAPSCSGTGVRDHPVVCVSWQDAADYCVWAGRRLPTEAEWEKAARGTDGRKYPWGDEAPDCGRLNYWGKDNGCVGNTAAVGSYPTGASPYGALDMAGNVWEWVADWYDATYYASSPAQNPTGPDAGQYRVLRGGSWFFSQWLVRAALRDRYAPVGSNDHIGFRCARSF